MLASLRRSIDARVEPLRVRVADAVVTARRAVAPLVAAAHAVYVRREYLAKVALQAVALSATAFVVAVALYALIYAFRMPRADALAQREPLYFQFDQPPPSSWSSTEALSSSSSSPPPPPPSSSSSSSSSNATALVVASLAAEALARAGDTLALPHAETSLSSSLFSGAEYTFDVELDVPDDDVNQRVGMLMLTLDVLDAQRRTLASSTRPLLFAYRSPLARALSSLLFAVPLALGIVDERALYRVTMVERYSDRRRTHAHSVRVTMNKRDVHVYSATLVVHSQLFGFTHLFHRYFITLSLLSIAALWAGVLVLLCCCYAFSNFAVPSPAADDGVESLGPTRRRPRSRRSASLSASPSPSPSPSARSRAARSGMPSSSSSSPPPPPPRSSPLRSIAASPPLSSAPSAFSGIAAATAADDDDDDVERRRQRRRQPELPIVAPVVDDDDNNDNDNDNNDKRDDDALDHLGGDDDAHDGDEPSTKTGSGVRRRHRRRHKNKKKE